MVSPRGIVKDLEDMARTYIKVSQHTDALLTHCLEPKQACSLRMLLPIGLAYQQLSCTTLLWVIATSAAYAAVAVATSCQSHQQVAAAGIQQVCTCWIHMNA